MGGGGLNTAGSTMLSLFSCISEKKKQKKKARSKGSQRPVLGVGSVILIRSWWLKDTVSKDQCARSTVCSSKQIM